MTTDPKQLTVREACDRYYVPACPEISRRTVQKLGHEWTLWEQHSGNPSIGEIRTDHFVRFRLKCIERELSAAYTESIVSDVLTVLRHCVFAGAIPVVPLGGKRLRRRPRLKLTPSIADLAAAYRCVEVAQWPLTARWARAHDEDGRFTPSGCKLSFSILWWQGVLAGIFFSALRRGDVLGLTWAEVREDRIVKRMAKTQFEIAIPIHPVLRAHLNRMPRVSPRVFGRDNCGKQFRRELHRICQAAGCPPFTFQAIRRLSSQAWQRARPGCGGLILGHAFRGADRYYLDPFQELQAAIPTLEVPAGMGSNPEVVETIRSMDRDEALKVLQTAVAELTASKGGAA